MKKVTLEENLALQNKVLKKKKNIFSEKQKVAAAVPSLHEQVKHFQFCPAVWKSDVHKADKTEQNN